MKLSTATVLVVSLAGSGLAAPAAPQSQRDVAMPDVTHAQPLTGGADLLRLVRQPAAERVKGGEKRSGGLSPVVDAVTQFLDQVVDIFLASIGLLGTRTITTMPANAASLDLGAFDELVNPLGLKLEAGAETATPNSANSGMPGQAGTGMPAGANTAMPPFSPNGQTSPAGTAMPAGAPNGQRGTSGSSPASPAGVPSSGNAAGMGGQS